MGTRWPETCWATYNGEINIILKVTSSWSLYPHWTTMHGQSYIKITLRSTLIRYIHVSRIKVISNPCRMAVWKTEGYWRITFGETCSKNRRWTELAQNSVQWVTSVLIVVEMSEHSDFLNRDKDRHLAQSAFFFHVVTLPWSFPKYLTWIDGFSNTSEECYIRHLGNGRKSCPKPSWSNTIEEV